MICDYTDLKANAIPLVENDRAAYDHCYISKDEKLIFIDDGWFYAVPWQKDWLVFLERAGFKRLIEIKFPFGKNLKANFKGRWNKLSELASQQS